MHEQELKGRLRAAMDHAAPDCLDQILSSCGEDTGRLVSLAPPRKRRRWAPMAVAAALAVVCGFGFIGWRNMNTAVSVVSLDVNPSIQLQVNQRDRVLSAEPLNQDARRILEGMDLRDTQLKVAVNAIIGSLLQNGYLDSLSSAILISVEDQDAQRAARLETDLTSEVNAVLQNASAGAAVLSQTLAYDAGLEEQAQTSQISVGKAALVRQVQALDRALDFDALAALSVEELEQMSRTGAPAMPIGRSQAAYRAQEYAGLLELDALTCEVDPELDEGTPHYEVELTTHFGEFDYDVDAYTGEILRGQASVLSAAPSGPPAQTDISGRLSEEQAVSVALKDAGVSRDAALGLQCRLEWDNGLMLYEVEFRAAGMEYEYDIRAADGAILKSEGEQGLSASGGQPGQISQEAALTAAFSHAGVSASDVYSVECGVDSDDGLTFYEIEFQAGQMEYEYEVDASTGAILKAEQEAGS